LITKYVIVALQSRLVTLNTAKLLPTRQNQLKSKSYKKKEILPSKFWRWAIFNLKKNRHFARKKGFHFLKMKKGLLAL
jgi:hypothetical protein